MTSRSRRRLRVLAGVALICAGGATRLFAQTLPASCTSFTDDPLVPGVTTVKAAHVSELRVCVDDLRVAASLPRMVWTDLSLEPVQSVIRAVHIVELRGALHAVYVARGQYEAPYTDPALTAQVTLIRAAHVTEIRQAALRVAGACTPEACGGPTNAALEYYHLDAVGSVRVVTDEAGSVIRRHDYLPFGETDAPPHGEDPLRFGGKEGDPESGLAYFEARYYRAWIGRFTTIDPGHIGRDLFDPQSWNAFSYALNNPVSFTDPTGLFTVPTICGFCALGFRSSEIIKTRASVPEGPEMNPLQVALMNEPTLMEGIDRTYAGDESGAPNKRNGSRNRKNPNNPSGGSSPGGSQSEDEESQAGAHPQSAGTDPLVLIAQSVWDRTKALTSPKTYAEVAVVSASGVGFQAFRLLQLQLAYYKYALAGGAGLNLLKNGERVFGLDWHRFKLNGEMVNRIHYHVGRTVSQMNKHRPWEGGWW